MLNHYVEHPNITNPQTIQSYITTSQQFFFLLLFLQLFYNYFLCVLVSGQLAGIVGALTLGYLKWQNENDQQKEEKQEEKK